MENLLVKDAWTGQPAPDTPDKRPLTTSNYIGTGCIHLLDWLDKSYSISAGFPITRGAGTVAGADAAR